MTSLPLKLSGRAVIVDASDAVLLIRRALQSRHWAGLWEFPGGKSEPGEDFATALLREVSEETSLTVELGRVLGAGEQAMSDRRIAFLFVEAKHLSGEVRLSDEHDAFAWVPRAFLPTYALCPQFNAVAKDYAANKLVSLQPTDGPEIRPLLPKP